MKTEITYANVTPPIRWQPKPYQLKALKFLAEHGAAGLFLDPGLGKTSITLAEQKVLQGQQGFQPALVVAPLRACYEVWPVEQAKWLDFVSLRVAVAHGSTMSVALSQKLNQYHLVVTNPESLPRVLGWAAAQRRWPFDSLVIDESTQFKNSQTVRFKALKPYLDRFRRRRILTGTPAPNGLLDLFGQLFILDGGRALGQYITQYRLRFFSPTGYGGYTWVPQTGSEEKIYAAVAHLVLRMSEADYLDLPPKIVTDIAVSLPPKARKIYNDLEAHLIADVLGNVVTAANVAVASMKCRQVANGGLYSSAATGTWVKLHDAKTDAVAERIDERGGKPVLVAVDFHHDAARLRKRFGARTPYLGAGLDPVEFGRTIRAWNAGDVPILLANPATAARSLNMQGVPGSSVILHSLTYNYEHYDQLIRRVWRQGRRGRVFVDRIVARDTVDEAIVGALGSKARTQGALLAALRAYAYRRPGSGRRITVY